MGIDARLEDFAARAHVAPAATATRARSRAAGSSSRLPAAEPLVFGLDLSLPPRSRARRVDRRAARRRRVRRPAGLGRASRAPAADPTILLRVAGEVHIAEVERIFRAKLGFAGRRAHPRPSCASRRRGFRIAGPAQAPRRSTPRAFSSRTSRPPSSARPEALVAEISKARYAGGAASGLLSDREPRRRSGRAEADDARRSMRATSRSSASSATSTSRAPGSRAAPRSRSPCAGRRAGSSAPTAARPSRSSRAPRPRSSGAGSGYRPGGGGTLSIVDGRIGFDGTTFRFPASSLELTGGLRIGQWTPDFDFRLRSRDLVEVDRLFQNFTAASGGRPEPLGLGGSGEVDGHIAKSWGNPEVTAQISAENASYAGVLFGSVRGTAGMQDGAFLFQPLRVYEGSATLSLEGVVRYRRDPKRPTLEVTVVGQGLPRLPAARLSRPRVSGRRTRDRHVSPLRQPARCGLRDRER